MLIGVALMLGMLLPAQAAGKRIPVTVEGTAVQSAPPDRYIILVGEGHVTAMPDIAVVSGGIVTHARHAGDALHDNSEVMAKVVAALKALGVTDREIGTANFSFSPQYDTDSKGNRDPSNRIVAYDVSNQVRVTLSNLELAGKVLDALIENGANDSATISFEIKDRDALEMQARAAAGKDVMQRAQIYAREVGAELGAVRSIHEGVYSPPGGGGGEFESVVVTGARASTRIEASEQEVSSTVTVVWALK